MDILLKWMFWEEKKLLAKEGNTKKNFLIFKFEISKKSKSTFYFFKSKLKLYVRK
jgi:hypothetical protein